MISKKALRCGFLLFVCAVALPAVSWEEIEPAHLQLDEPRLDPAADAEALFWEVWIEDSMQGSMPQTTITEYLRIKVFNDRGVEDYSTIDLAAATRDIYVVNVRARTIKADGRIVDLENNEVYERTVVKSGDRRVRMKSFSLPNVEAGDIIEYQFQRIYDNSFANYVRLYFQLEVPTWRVQYHVKPSEAVARLGYEMRSQSFNVAHSGFESEPRGFYAVSAEDIPAFKTEPYMPPEDHVRGWVLLFYSRKSNLDSEKFWKQHAKDKYKEYSQRMRIDGKVKETAAALTEGIEDPAEKIAKVRDYCLTEIKNIYHDRYGVTADERQELDDRRRASDTIAAGMGDGNDLIILFAALARAAGLDAYIAQAPGRNDRFFNQEFLNPFFLNRHNVAVQLGGDWRFYDPSSPYIEEGMLRWPEEGVPALILDPKDPKFVETPLSGPERNVVRRRGTFTLLADGTLEGDVIAQYHGHLGWSEKVRFDGMTPEERQAAIRDDIRERLSTAEVSDIRIGGADAVDRAVAYRYRLRAPGFAARTGSRLFLQPAFFQFNEAPAFTSSERTHDIYFRYPWSEDDYVEITLPEGYELEEAEAPGSTTIQSVGQYAVSLSRTPDGRKLIYHRKFEFGQNGMIYFPADVYGQLKGVFDFMHEQDAHTVTLRAANDGR